MPPANCRCPLVNEIRDFGRRLRLESGYFHTIPATFNQERRHDASPSSSFRLRRRCHHRGLPSARRPRKDSILWRCQARYHRGTDRERSLYLVTGKEQALKYSVGVGRSGQQWFGTTRIASKHIKPAWKPPVSLRGNRSPDFYIDGGSL